MVLKIIDIPSDITDRLFNHGAEEVISQEGTQRLKTPEIYQQQKVAIK